MNTHRAIKIPGPGDWALIKVEFELYGLDDNNRDEEFICRVMPHQKVEIASAPTESINPRTGESFFYISVKIVDTLGIHRFIHMELRLLIFAANDTNDPH
jgi:hypothetical protein